MSFSPVSAVILSILFLVAAGLATKLLQTGAPPRGRYVIGTNHSPPFQMVNESGRVEGPLAETFELAARKLGIELEWVVMSRPPDQYLSDSESGIDLWPLVMRLPERNERFYITEPYAGSQYVLFSKHNYGADPSALPPDLLIGYARFRHTATLFHRNFPTQRSFQAEQPVELMNAVCEDQIDAAVVEVNAADSFLQDLPRNCGEGRIYLQSLPGWRIELGIGARFGREDVANALRTELGRMARSGELNGIFDRHLALDRLRQRNLFVATRDEELARDLTLALMACLVALCVVTAKVMMQRRQKIAAMSTAAAKSAFLASMSHEIRTPLTGVLGMAELLSHSKLDEQQASHLEQIRSAGQRLLAIVNDVLVLSKLESGRMEFQPKPTRVQDLLHEVLAPLAVVAASKHLELIVDVHPDVPEVVTIDRLKAGQILTNIVGNAVKFSDAGGICVSLALAGTPSIARFLRFEISDTGVGIAAEDLRKIFESYGQADTANTANSTGLGLPIARMMALQMGGFFGVTSELGKGSTFWFELPLTADDASTALNQAKLSRFLEPVTIINAIQSHFLHEKVARALSQRGAECYRWLPEKGWENGEGFPADRRIVCIGDVTDIADPRRDTLAGLTEMVSKCGASLVLLSLPRFSKEDSLETSPRLVRVCKMPVYIHELVRAVLSARQTEQVARHSAVRDPAANGTAGDSDSVSAQLLILRNSLTNHRHEEPSGIRVLVAEDNEVNQRIMSAMIGKLGASCDIANNGQEAISKLEKSAYDLVLMDCRMPGCDGLEATAIIRRASKPYSAIPIIGVSAELEAVQRTSCLEAGMDGFMEKPYSMGALSAVLEPYVLQSKWKRNLES